MMPIIKFIPTNAFITSFVVSKLQVFCIAYMFVFVTMISRSLFIPVTVWNMPKVLSHDQDQQISFPLNYIPFSS